MPKDADYGRELARLLCEEFLQHITHVNFTYDAYLEMDKLEPNESYCVISPNSFNRSRLTRGDWETSITLSLTMVSSTGSTASESEIDNWLDSWDLLNAEVQSVALFDRHKISVIDSNDRYDVNHFHSDRRLVTQVVLGINSIT